MTLNRRFHLFGLFAVMLALMAQLASGATVPRVDPVAVAGVLCHSDDASGGAPSKAPGHAADCTLCPLCGTLHVQQMVLVPQSAILLPPILLAAGRPELPPPSTAPPSRHRPSSQPRAPPTNS